MKILFVTGIFPPDHGGPARYVPAIAGELQKRGHQVVAVVTLSDQLDHDDSIYGFPLVRLRRSLPRPLRVILTIKTILSYARQAEVVYLNGLVFEGILATRLLRRPRVVIKVVGDLIWEKAQTAGATKLNIDAFQVAQLPWRWRVLRWLQGWYTGAADMIVVPSRYLQGIVRRWGIDPERIRVIHNAVSLPPSQEATARQYDLVTVARLVPWKGIAVVIEAAAENGWSLRVVGDGPLMGELRALAERLRACVSFAGNVAAERVLEELRNARLFVLNSSYEGLPHILLEAKAAGVAVVATAAGGTPEVMRHDIDGWMVPVGNREALVSALRHLLASDADRARLADAGRRQVETEYSLEALADATEKVLARSF